MKVAGLMVCEKCDLWKT